jgi:hypothetical protein
MRRRLAPAFGVIAVITFTAVVAGASPDPVRPLPPAPSPQSAAQIAPQPSAAFPGNAPQLPRNFRARGRYIVPSIGADVPFTWNATDGNMQMTAGGPEHLIWFTNLIYEGKLYTYTYEFPGAPDVPCLPPVGNLTLPQFNSILATNVSHVGTEVLVTPWGYRAEHWRMSFVAPPFPLAAADIYVDPKDPTVWRQVLHFGLQNLYAPDQDEWIRLRTWENRPGPVELPSECIAP